MNLVLTLYALYWPRHVILWLLHRFPGFIQYYKCCSVSRGLNADVASQTRDAHSSRSPGLTSGLKGSTNVCNLCLPKYWWWRHTTVHLGGWADWLLNVTFIDISVIFVTAHRCAGGPKNKLHPRSGSQRHGHFLGFFNVPVQAQTRVQCISPKGWVQLMYR